MQSTTRLLFIRHAQSVANAEHRAQGWGDAPLSARGTEQAHHLAAWLRANNPQADLLVSSPLQRAHQTASAIAPVLGLPLQVRAGLKEVHLGRLEDMPIPEFDALLSHADLTDYGAESISAFAERIIGTLDELIAANEGRTLVIVSHLGVIVTAVAHWIDGDVTIAWDKYGRLMNTGMTELALRATQWELRYHAAAPHFASVPAQPGQEELKP